MTDSQQHLEQLIAKLDKDISDIRAEVKHITARLDNEDGMISDADWVEIDTGGLSVKEYLDQRKGDKTYYELVEELKAEAAKANNVRIGSE
jgi:hypothetical protein